MPPAWKPERKSPFLLPRSSILNFVRVSTSERLQRRSSLPLTASQNSLFSRHLLEQLPPATLSKRLPARPYCAKLSKTYVIATLVTLYTPSTSDLAIAVADLLIDVENFLKHYIATMDDGYVAGGRFDWPGNEKLVLRAWNTNNHQLTYGVLAAAAQALQVWAWGDGWGLLKFDIYDGTTKVGKGIVEIPELGR